MENQNVDQNLIPTIIDKSINVFRGGAAIIRSHQDRAAKAMAACESCLKQFETAFAIEDPEQKKTALAAADVRANKLLVNCRTAQPEMEGERKAITQLMREIATMFTVEENKLDVTVNGGLPNRLQELRNKYAKWNNDEKARVQADNDRKMRKATEATEIRAAVNKYIADWTISLLSEKTLKMGTAFNGITLDDFDDKEKKLRNAVTTFDMEKVKTIVPASIRVSFSQHDAMEVEKIVKDAISNYDYGNFCIQYQNSVENKKSELINRLDSKKAELQEAKRLKDEAEKNEQKRLKEMEKQKSDAARKKLELEQQQAREREQKEREDLERQRKDREAEERRIEEENKLKMQKEEEQRIEISTAGEHAQALFDQVADTLVDQAASPQTKTGFVIKVLHPTAWVELFTYWFQEKGCKMSVEDLENVKFTQIKKFVADAAKDKKGKNGTKINSKLFVYEEELKAVNKKEKVSE